MNKQNIYELEPSELSKSLDGPSFRTTQVLNWVYKKLYVIERLQSITYNF